MASARGTSKARRALFFEDFEPGQVLRHGAARTVTEGDVAVYHALYGARFALQSSDEFARAVGLPCAPVDEFLTAQIVLGRSVPEVSPRAVADSLGITHGRFGIAVYPGDTVGATSTVIGLQPDPDGEAGVVHLHTVGANQDDETVFECAARVRVRRRSGAAPVDGGAVPDLPPAVAPEGMVLPRGLRVQSYDFDRAGSPHRWGDYEVGEVIGHGGGTIVDQAGHHLAARFFRSTMDLAPGGDPGRCRPAHCGHLLGLARALSFNGLENAFRVLAINRVAHRCPVYPGDTLHARSEVLERLELPGVSKVGALRVRLVAESSDAPGGGGPSAAADGVDVEPRVALDLDYTVALPR